MKRDTSCDPARWTRVVALGLLLHSFVLPLVGVRAAQQREYEARSAQVLFGDSREPATTTLKQLNPPSEEWYIAGSDLAEILQVGRFWRSDVRKLVLRVGNNRITLTVDARAVVSEEKSIMLRAPVLMHQGEPWIPMEFLTQVLPAMTARGVTWDSQTFTLSIGVRQLNITTLEFDVKDLTTELRVRMRAPLAFRVDDSRPRDLVLKIYGGHLDPQQLLQASPQGLVESVESLQEEGYALLTVHLSELASRYQSLSQDDGHTIVLRVEQAPLATIPEPVPKGPKLVQTLPPETAARKVTVRKVILDPGHGGADIGREGEFGLLEKDITLAICREVKRVLERKEGIQVVLTRQGDDTIGLTERTELANRENGDLFISIHCNGWLSSEAHGVETYFLSPAKTEWDASVAKQENASIDAAHDIDFILWDIVQNLYIQESATLAEAVQSRLTEEMGLHDRGVKQAGFRVLVGAYMPAILVEVGFLSNKDEARMLADHSFHTKLAQALTSAVLNFRDRMEAVREEAP
jgi:N-acetylmuramoyl-L-alanine amidase